MSIYVLSPSLWRHTSLASFHSFGTVDVEIDKFMIAVRRADIVGAASFNSRAGISSRPLEHSLSPQALIKSFALWREWRGYETLQERLSVLLMTIVFDIEI